MCIKNDNSILIKSIKQSCFLGTVAQSTFESDLDFNENLPKKSMFLYYN